MPRKPDGLNNVLWLGGSPCSGKSSIVRRLVEEYDLTPYHCDDHFDRHVQDADPTTQPRLHWVAGASWDEIFMRPIEVMIEDEHEIYRQEFSMICADLAELLRDGGPGSEADDAVVIAEGAALLPQMVAPLLPSRRHGLWLVPSAEFQLEKFPGRGPWLQEILGRCSQPEQAFRNWMERDVGYARQVKKAANELDLSVIVVDGSESLNAIAERVRAHFGPCLA